MSDLLPPKVSICMPVYNGSEYIAETIESVLSQTYENFQLIVCDNCSTDNTEEIVRSFDDPRIRYVRNARNLGLVGNANRCLELAEGEYIGIFHHDDVMLPDNLERKVRMLEGHPEIGLVHSNLILVDPSGSVVAPDSWSEDARSDSFENGMTAFERFLSTYHLSSSIFIGTVLARRSCYERVGFFSPELPHCNDGEMWMRMLLFYNVACIGTPLVKYRVHPMSASTSWGDYTSLPYLKEHYLAAKMVFAKNGDRIPQAESLKYQVSRAFAERALQLAYGNLVGGDFAAGKMFLKEAINMSPAIIKNADFWKIKLGLSAGGILIKMYRLLKNIRSRAGLLKKLLQCKFNLIETTAYAPSYKGNPMVTFLIPHKDCSLMLKLCIDSISKYTTVDYRIIIADDNSDEKEFNNILDLRTPNISIYRFQKTRGHPFMLEWLYHKARSQYIVFLDQDSILLSDAWQSLLKELEMNERLLLIGVRDETPFRHSPQMVHPSFLLINKQRCRKAIKNPLFFGEIPLYNKYSIGQQESYHALSCKALGYHPDSITYLNTYQTKYGFGTVGCYGALNGSTPIMYHQWYSGRIYSLKDNDKIDSVNVKGIRDGINNFLIDYKTGNLDLRNIN